MAPALALFLLAPVSAEYLIGYDNTVGNPAALLGGLLILAPLYGGPALIIRELTRRTGRGWPTMLLLATAFGVVQAGLVDQSLFDPSYRDIDYWAETRNPTLVPALGVSVNQAVGFLAGHVIWSIGAPIALVEALAARRGSTPWLRTPWLVVAGVLYVLASALILSDQVGTAGLAPVPQLAGAGVVVVTLVVAAFAIRPAGSPAIARRAPNPWLVGAVALAGLSVHTLMPATWLGTIGAVGVLAALGIGAARLSRRRGWGAPHRLALTAGALLAYAWIAFLVEPLGDVPVGAKLAHNLTLAVGVVVLIALAARAVHRVSAIAEPAVRADQ